jgi:triacylglycerol lipase
MHTFLKEKLPYGVGVNFVAHSMGGLDVRHLISTIKPDTYKPLSLTTIGTPHRGSPFMDWCAANIGVGTAAAVASAALGAEHTKNLPFSLKSPLLSRAVEEKARKEGIGAFTSALTAYLLNIFDSPAYSNLTTSFLGEHFNPNTPDSPSVKYTSVAGRVAKMSVLHPLWFPKLVLDAAGERGYPSRYEMLPYPGNDGLVPVSSAKWGEFLGTVDTHHWDLRGEGGLFPQGGSVSLKPEGKPDESMPGGWDWQDGAADSIQRNLGLAAPNRDRDLSDSDKKKLDIAQDQLSKKIESDSGSSWDLAQVGQVIDWVTDLLPGGGTTETSKKQMADARREKEESLEGEANGSGTREAKEKEKRKKDKFDLARFYGGLMLKLRDDGY